MSSAWVRQITHSLGWRISAWYALGFVASFALIAAFAQFLLTDAALHEDRREIKEEFDQDAARCRQIGSEHLTTRSSEDFTDEETTLIRLSRPDGTPAMLIPPLGEKPRAMRWAQAALTQHRTAGWQQFPAHDNDSLWQVYAGEMPDHWWLQVAKSNHRGHEMQERLGDALLPVAGLAMLVALAGAAGLTARALRPVRRLIDATHAVVDSGDMTARVPTRSAGGHELDELNSLFNRMLAKNEALIRGMRDALDNVAHDLRTPLTRMRSKAEAALSNPDATAAEHRDALAGAIEESEGALEMLRTLMDISEAEHGSMRLHLEPLELHALAAAALELYAHVAEERGVHVRTEFLPGLRVLGDRVRLQQVIANLVDNAIKYSAPGGEIVVSGARRDAATAQLIVRDRGIGILAHDLPRIWDRLYRGDQSRSEQGTGLGLSLVRAVVQAHGGHAEAESEPGAGSVFTITLPTAEL